MHFYKKNLVTEKNGGHVKKKNTLQGKTYFSENYSRSFIQSHLEKALSEVGWIQVEHKTEASFTAQNLWVAWCLLMEKMRSLANIFSSIAFCWSIKHAKTPQIYIVY